ncbi:DUF4349 domain-containing protein [Flavobacterium sp.]|uniref:DUF4349 domain-containing protein n=1 Tax=Flavobacterium sp. TaxID=239 RepID=UPI0037507864
MKNIFSFLFLTFLLLGCKENANEEAEALNSSITTIKIPPREMSSSEDRNYDKSEDVKPKNNNNYNGENIEQKIIKYGDLRFETNDLDETHKTIQTLIKKYKIVVQNDSEGKDDYTIYRNLRLRIANESFDEFIKEISTGINYFDRKNISVDDVTEEYIDVTSRIKTKKALEERYIELLKKANKVSEMLEIEKELATIREEIEAKEGRLRYIENKVSMSTITIEFYKTLEHKAGATVSFGTKFVNAIKSGFNGISSFFIWLIEVWPFIIILVAIMYFIKKRFKKKNT